MDDTDAGSNSLNSADNIFIGSHAGAGTWTNVLSQYNIGIGTNTLDGGLDGADYNVMIGYGAGTAITTAEKSIGIGGSALLSATTSTLNSWSECFSWISSRSSSNHNHL